MQEDHLILKQHLDKAVRLDPVEMANLTDEEIFQLLDNSDIEIDFLDDSDADPDWIVEPAERIGAELQSTIVEDGGIEEGGEDVEPDPDPGPSRPMLRNQRQGAGGASVHGWPSMVQLKERRNLKWKNMEFVPDVFTVDDEGGGLGC
ncbi:hypothetical protein LSTR_LSTR001647 [Laodelphax striatellus]|uniref:Uncharacterized protein n=1 Tax=Laodelphax striatellus TaxID=195883 RepID=A0A482XCA5_LAOST|nr:hypothetical protein LSTR_LSTR001647 [Laodelphax striatellus]